MKKDVTNAGKNTDDNRCMKKYVTNGPDRNTDDYNVWKRMSLMHVGILMIIMYEKGCP